MDLSSFPTRPSLLSSSSGWRDRLQDASFRGVPFKVEEESAGTGRRVETHEPERDKPYTEDLGKSLFALPSRLMWWEMTALTSAIA